FAFFEFGFAGGGAADPGTRDFARTGHFDFEFEFRSADRFEFSGDFFGAAHRHFAGAGSRAVAAPFDEFRTFFRSLHEFDFCVLGKFVFTGGFAENPCRDAGNRAFTVPDEFYRELEEFPEFGKARFDGFRFAHRHFADARTRAAAARPAAEFGV